MKMNVTTKGIEIVPETAVDIIYIEKHLNLKKDGDSINCTRKNAMGLSCLRLDTADTELNNIAEMNDKQHDHLKYKYQPFIIGFDSYTCSHD